MQTQSEEPNLIDVAGTYGAFLSMIEIGLGSLIHAFNIPFGGFFLSLNQGFVLSRSIKTFREYDFCKSLPLYISNITALLKSLSPAGNRLGPMIAIAMQGLLFNIGIFIFGCNLFGAMIGVTLLSLWSYFQIGLYFYLMFGKKLIDVFNFHFQEIQRVFPLEASDVFWAVGLLILLKIILGILLSFFAFTLHDQNYQNYQRKILKAYRPRNNLHTEQNVGQALRGSLKDLFSPIFIITFLLMATFFVLSGSSWQETTFYLIRPLAIGFLLFFSIRVFPVKKIIPHLAKTRLRKLSLSLAKAFDVIKKN